MGSEMERCLEQENKFGAKLAGNDKVYEATGGHCFLPKDWMRKEGVGCIKKSLQQAK